MNSSKIVCDLLFKRLSISQLAEIYAMSKAEVVKSVFAFLIRYPNSSRLAAIKHRLKLELAKDFLATTLSPLDFAEEYGMDERYFRKIMNVIVEDTTIISSDILADHFYRKLMTGTVLKSKAVPKRIVRQIAKLYVGERYYTQDNIANIYSTRRETISAILKRGIAQNIVDDVTAEKIIVKIRGYCRYVDSYSAAFDERLKLQREQS